MIAPVLYTFVPGTGEWLGRGEASPNAEGDGYFVPALATLLAPPKVPKGQKAVFRDGAWSLVADHRGETWHGADGSAVIVDRLGDPATFDPPLSAKALPPQPVDLAAYISAGHKALRDGGVSVGGMRIATDGESRGLIDGAYALSQSQPEGTIDFKASSGWITVDAQTMQTVALAVGRWVQACYSAYRKLDEGRATGTVKTTAQVDAAYAAVSLPG